MNNVAECNFGLKSEQDNWSLADTFRWIVSFAVAAEAFWCIQVLAYSDFSLFR